MGRSLDVIELPSSSAFFREIACVENLDFDLVLPDIAESGMQRPGHISAMKIATIHRIGVKLFERPHPSVLWTLL